MGHNKRARGEHTRRGRFVKKVTTCQDGGGNSLSCRNGGIAGGGA